MSRTLFDPLTCPDTSFISSDLFLLYAFAITATNNMALITSSSSVSLDTMLVARFVAAAFGMVAERATLLCNKLCSKVVQQKSGVSSALESAWVNDSKNFIASVIPLKVVTAPLIS